jgi:hypothetical protein
MIVSYDSEKFKAWMETYRQVLNLRGSYTEETLRLLKSAKEIPEELRGDLFNRKIESLERIIKSYHSEQRINSV